MLPSVAMTTCASRKRASRRMRPIDDAQTADVHACARRFRFVALRMIGTALRCRQRRGPGEHSAARTTGFSSPAPSIIIMRQIPRA